MGEIVKIEQYIGHAVTWGEILIMDRRKAFGAINRAQLWAKIDEKGLQGVMIKRIRGGHQGTKLAPKYKRKYGARLGKT